MIRRVVTGFRRDDTSMTRQTPILIALLAAAALTLAACGRAGPLKPPPGAAPPPDATATESAPADADTATISTGQPRRPGPQAPNPERRFILDGLI